MLSFNLSIKTKEFGQLVFYESIRVKIFKTFILFILVIFAYSIAQQFDGFALWRNSWYPTIAFNVGLLMLVFIWLQSSVTFDEMMKIVFIKRGLTKFLPAKQVNYAAIQCIVLKRFGQIDEEGHVTNQGYFHLKLNNGNSYLVLIFNHSDAIENARKRLVKHSQLTVQTF